LSFYGPGPAEHGDWLKVPGARFWAYVRMLPRLQAEQALETVSQVAAGTGSMEKDAAKAYLRDLRDEVRAGGREKAPRATLGRLREFGVRMRPREGVSDER
jgi:hypothetical protein